MEDSPVTFDLLAHPEPLPPTSPQPPSSSLTLLSPLSPELTRSPLSSVPIKPVLDPIIGSPLLESRVFTEGSSSVTSTEDLFHKRTRHYTIDSIPSSTEMDGSSTVATSPPPSRAEDTITKLGANSNILPSSDQQEPVEAAAAVIVEPESTLATSASSQRPPNNRTSSGLNKPKTEHLEYFLSSLPSDSSHLSVEQAASRPRSPGRVPAAVYALEEAHKRHSQGSDRGSIRKSQENRRPDVTSHPMPVEVPCQSVEAPPPMESARPENTSSAAPAAPAAPAAAPAAAANSNTPGRASDKQNGAGRGKKGGLRYLIERIRSNSTGKKVPNIVINQQGSKDTIDSSSTPISAVSNGLYPGVVVPRVDGKDPRNLATWHRDLRRDFENRRLEGKHEHPVEGSTALNHRSGIRSMGLKQLFRSISQTLQRAGHGFKKLTLRRVKSIPNKLTVTVLGHPPPSQPESNKKLTRRERERVYIEACETDLPTFGPRVPTPPPREPISRRPSTELEHQGAAGASSSKQVTTSPAYLTPQYRQIGLFASKPYEVAAKLTGKGKAVNHLTNGDATPIKLPNGKGYPSDPQFSSSSSSQSIDAAPHNRKNVPTTQPSANQNVAAQASPAVKKEGAGGGFLGDAFKGW
ncbi:hypothetical protein TWF281_001736 [Arthrobotrys megalospora]